MEYIPELVSVIMPVYNSSRYLGEAIESVLGQSYEALELILIDDASSDESVTIIHSYQAKDPRVHLIALEENQGAAVSRNAGLRQARGQYVAFLDSDDLWVQDKLRRQLDFMKTQGHDFTFTAYAFITSTGSIRPAGAQPPFSLDYRGLLKNTAIPCSTVVIDQASIGSFQMPLVRRGQDTATWLMLMRERGVIAYSMNEVLSYYRQVDQSLSSNKWCALKRTWHTYRHLEELPLIPAMYYFIHYAINAIRRRS